MCNAANKSLLIISLSALLACGNADNQEKVAQELFNQAQTNLQADRPEIALQLIDSLDTAYPSFTALRRQGLHLRALAQEKLIVKQLAETDSTLMELKSENVRLSGGLQKVDNAIEPYYIAKGSSLAPTGIHARISPDGVAYIVSSVSGHNTLHTRVVAKANGEEKAETAIVGYDGERATRDGNVETVHFVGAECDSILRFITSAQTPVTVTWIGKSSYSRPLTQGEQKAIATVGQYVETASKIKVAELEHQRLEKQLEIARSQAARTFVEDNQQSR